MWAFSLGSHCTKGRNCAVRGENTVNDGWGFFVFHLFFVSLSVGFFSVKVQAVARETNKDKKKKVHHVKAAGWVDSEIFMSSLGRQAKLLIVHRHWVPGLQRQLIHLVLLLFVHPVSSNGAANTGWRWTCLPRTPLKLLCPFIKDTLKSGFFLTSFIILFHLD